MATSHDGDHSCHLVQASSFRWLLPQYLNWLPDSTLANFCLLNTATTVILKCKSDITPWLQSLQWLPKHQIKAKTYITVSKALHHLASTRPVISSPAALPLAPAVPATLASLLPPCVRPWPVSGHLHLLFPLPRTSLCLLAECSLRAFPQPSRLTLHPLFPPASTYGPCLQHGLHPRATSFTYCVSTPTRMSDPGRQELLTASSIHCCILSSLGTAPGTGSALNKHC